jgi:hypothetical protein
MLLRIQVVWLVLLATVLSVATASLPKVPSTLSLSLSRRNIVSVVAVRGGANVEEEENEESSTTTTETEKAEKKIETTDSEDEEAESSAAISNTPTTPTADYTLEEDAGLTKEESSADESSAVLEEEEDTQDDDDDDKIQKASTLRLQGKEFHDSGDFVQAALLFQQAADTLGQDDLSESEDYATCRLHQALCHLKSQDFTNCVDACTNVLEYGFSTTTPAVRARAFHRRAKAKLGLEDASGALQDARSAAFLGDRKAVALYGKLMRESSSATLMNSSGDGNDNYNYEGGAAPSPFESIFGGKNGSSGSSSSALLESLLNKSSSTSKSMGDGAAGGTGAASSSLLGDFPVSLLLGKGGLGGALANNGGTAKSVLQSLSKKLQDDSTQTTICTYLQNTSKAQLSQLASMAGVGISDGQLSKIVNVCHGVTPTTIKKTVRRTKRAIWVVQLIRKFFKVVSKYKSLIVALALLQWTKCAVLCPIPINQRAAKKALKAAMKASRK